MVDISLIMGSESDRAIANRAVSVIENQVHLRSNGHFCPQKPDELDIYISNTDAKVFITIAGLSAALPGVVASKTKNLS